MRKKEIISQERNQQYFQSLINTRISLKNLSFYLASLFVGVLMLSMYWLVGKDYGIEASQTFLGRSLVVSVGFMTLFILFLVFPPLKKIVFQHQDIAGIFQNIFMLILIFSLSLLMIFVSGIAGSGFDLDRMAILGWIFLIVYIISIFYNVFWLKGQLQAGFSEERTQKNFLAKPAVKNTGSLAIIFSGSLAGRWATAGQANILGIVGGLFLLIVFSRLTVELLYANILKWRNKEYWEEYHQEDGAIIPKKEWLFIVRLMVEMGFFFGIIYFGQPLIEQKSPLLFPLRMVTIGILIYWIVRILLWLKRRRI
ncbi:TPA: hypothetical protein ACHU7H_001446 [Streptococcus suis]